MKKAIERLRTKSKKERQRVAFAGAFVITSIIALVWLSVVATRFDSSAQTAQVEGPIDSLTDSVSDAFNGQ